MGSDANPVVKWVMKLLLKLSWSVGGGADDFPRVSGEEIEGLVSGMLPGDIVLMGNGGGLSHVGVHVGDGVVVHSMATEKTMRGFAGSLWDALRRPLWWLRGVKERTGVIEERLSAFYDRYERDAYAVLRRAGLSSEQRAAGVARVRELIGKAYDYDFSPGDDEYYCSELVVEFLEVAEGSSPDFPTIDVKVPMVLTAQAIEPISFLKSGHFDLVVVNEAARLTYSKWLDPGSDR